jgi:hypothetical protein
MDGDFASVARMMSDLSSQGYFQVPKRVLDEIQSVVKAGWCSQVDCLRTIKVSDKANDGFSES